MAHAPRQTPGIPRATHPCPRCGFPVPIGQRFCPNCAFPQPPRRGGCLIAILVLLVLVVLVSLALGWANPSGERPPSGPSPVRGIARTATPVPQMDTPGPEGEREDGWKISNWSSIWSWR